jgi:hypothetical protein
MSPGDLLHPDTWKEGKIPKSITFSCNVASTTAILSAVSGVKHRILAAAFGAGSQASFGFYAGASLIFGPVYLAANANIELPLNKIGWFQTSHGQVLNGWETAAATVTGVLIYVED